MPIDTTVRPTDSEHDRLYKQAIALVQDHLPLHDRPANHRPAGFFLRRRLRKGLRLLDRIAAINPRNYAALWTAGMTCRRLGDLEGALDRFRRAHALRPDQPDVAREAAITASHLGRPADAIEFTRRALAALPNDPGLTANLALYHLYNQDPTTARQLAAAALAAEPSDRVTAHVVRLIDEVLANRRPCPRTDAEALRPPLK